MGELFFSAQYQQEPIPAAGNLIKAAWLKTFDTPPERTPEDRLVISLDTAMKGTELSDFSVATVWLVRKDNCYLIDLWRERANYPDLKKAVLNLVERHPGAALLIEDKASGTRICELKIERPSASPLKAIRSRASPGFLPFLKRSAYSFLKRPVGSVLSSPSCSAFRICGTTIRLIP